MAHPPPGDPGDDGISDGDLAALDFGAAADDDTRETDLGVILGDYSSDGGDVDAATDDDPIAAFPSPGFAGADGHADDAAAPLFTVANPPGTVTVTTFLDGRVHRVDEQPQLGGEAAVHDEQRDQDDDDAGDLQVEPAAVVEHPRQPDALEHRRRLGEPERYAIVGLIQIHGVREFVSRARCNYETKRRFACMYDSYHSVYGECGLTFCYR
mgnify:CR=1 FL=1